MLRVGTLDNDDDCRSVEEVISYLVPKLNEKLSYLLDDGSSSNEPQTQLLKLDISKAKNYLHWHPRWNIECALDKVIGGITDGLIMRIFRN